MTVFTDPLPPETVFTRVVDGTTTQVVTQAAASARMG